MNSGTEDLEENTQDSYQLDNASSINMQRFNWTHFYEAVADRLLTFQDRRNELITGINQIASTIEQLSYLQDQFENEPKGPLKDICPFTVMGMFNRGITNDNRKVIASELAKLLEVSEPVPDVFDGIPLLNNFKSWFFGYDKNRKTDDIDSLWKIFAKAMAFVKSKGAEGQSEFIAAYDDVAQRYNVGWNLTMGLYWIRPWEFPTLEEQSQNYIRDKLNIQIEKNGAKDRCSAFEYLKLRETLKAKFKEEAFPVHSFPELSFAAWNFKDSGKSAKQNAKASNTQVAEAGTLPTTENKPTNNDLYTIDDILKEDCFMEKGKLEEILERLRTKKNLILQGPPGTGKTWLARRLAFALMGKRDESKVKAVQFHPNLSYEDFIRGWRPSGEGKLELIDGPFMAIINAALQDAQSPHVIVIEEMNRGNPAQIFGEMLTLLESGKRKPCEALALSYMRTNDKPVFIPENLYVIGTMNIADRSLALVDLALRRRFAFIDLEPTLGKPWYDYLAKYNHNFDLEILKKIERRINDLNITISNDKNLGPQYQVGHSYVTPDKVGADNPSDVISDVKKWFYQVVDTEIGPLLDEYWFDDLDKSKAARTALREGF